jgi:phosphoribosyl-ATP pyrophosphohydrolase
MSDSLERLFQAVMAAKDLDPARSRTAKLFHRGQARMAKKLAEEAIEVVIDAVNGETEAVVRESADLLYNLLVLWASAGVRPEDVWAEMDRREKLLGIAEKMPKALGHKSLGNKASGHKSSGKPAAKPFAAARQAAPRAGRARMAAASRERKRR